MANIFDSIAFNKIRSSRFDLSHDIKLSFQMGRLIPTAVMECMPGDSFEIQIQNLMRFAPLIAPVMHKVEIKTHYFFVPNRLLWDNWEDFITDKADVVHPYVDVASGFTLGEIQEKSLADYMGVPVGEYEEPLKVSPMPFAAYLKIYDEYYRDQNLMGEVFQPLADGNNGAVYGPIMNTAPKRGCWKRDYLTSALPFAQKGDAITIPLTQQDDIEVEYDAANTNPGLLVDVPSGTPAGAGNVTSSIAGQMGVAGDSAAYDPNGSLTVDVQAGAADIETLRTAWTIQGWLERQARGGSRYFEQLMSMFGIKSPDQRLQRPEYIGGSTQNMVISEVMSTAQSANDPETATVAVGTMAGHGISVGGGNTLRYSCQEHGWIIGIVMVRPLTAYQDGLHRKFARFDKFDYPWPQFANLGEQEVKQFEVRAMVEAGTDPLRTFGYQSRYAEMKHENNRVAGEMRSTLDYWHLGRKFITTADPELTSAFVECNPSTRIFAVTDSEADHIYAHIFNNVQVRRKLPRFGIPWVMQ